MKIARLLPLLFFFIGSIPAFAVDFFSTEKAPNLFNLGVRVGVNASNTTFSKEYFEKQNVNSWGAGFEGGVVANLNFRNYFTLQPGIFFESRSGNYTYATEYITNFQTPDISYQLGHILFYDIAVPVMAVFNFNIADKIRWTVEVGPYLQYNLKKPAKNKINVLYRNPTETDYNVQKAISHVYDYGIKFGSGINVYSHYYFGIHYEMGLRPVWGFPEGGVNKAWTFTVGYDF